MTAKRVMELKKIYKEIQRTRCKWTYLNTKGKCPIAQMGNSEC